MSSTSTSWEQSLVQKATAALKPPSPVYQHLSAKTPEIRAAYLHCEAITREHSRTFYMATALVPMEKRHALRALYAFCRISDSLVDGAGDRAGQLAKWREALHTHMNNHPVLQAWYDTCSRYSIPSLYTEQLLEALAQDLTVTRYATFEDLVHYCYGVASTVGLMSMYIIGYCNDEAIPYAIKLGVALQLTNILRDVGEDWRQGRLYLPQDELNAFGLTEADIAAARVDERWRTFMSFQIERTRHLYAESLPGIAYLHPDGRLAVAAAAELYRAILDDIEAYDYDVFTRRAHVSEIRKLILLPIIAWRVYTNRYTARQGARL